MLLRDESCALWISMPLAALQIDASSRRGLVDAVLAADEDRLAEALVDEGQRGANHLLLALGEDHALGEFAHALEDPLSVPATGSRRAESCAL